jgi:hypothetical protein
MGVWAVATNIQHVLISTLTKTTTAAIATTQAILPVD